MTRSTHIGFLTLAALAFVVAIAVSVPELPVVQQRFQLQETETDCGPAALSYVLKHFQIDAAVSELRTLTGESGSGTSMLELKRAAESYGLSVEGWKIVPADLERIPRPAIVLIHDSHFAVLKEVHTDRVILVDPAHGETRMSRRLFLQSWHGYTLTFNTRGREPASEPATT